MSSEYVYENPAGEYFEEAVAAFVAPQDSMRSLDDGWARRLDRRLRLAVLFAAFSAEAFSNAFLAFALDDTAAKALDRKPTTDKFILGPGALAEPPRLALGVAPLQTVSALFRERDRIVHARPERAKRSELGLRVDPNECAQWIIGVADCVYALSEALEGSPFMGPLETMYDLGDEIDDWDAIESERRYFFTGGLIHAVRERRDELTRFGAALGTSPDAAATEGCSGLLQRGRDLEAQVRA
jgi:hypothetical protein